MTTLKNTATPGNVFGCQLLVVSLAIAQFTINTNNEVSNNSLAVCKQMGLYALSAIEQIAVQLRTLVCFSHSRLPDGASVEYS